MKALTWQGRQDVRVLDVPDPRIELPTDAIVRITSSAICGSDLHLYNVLGPFLSAGDVLGHEAMGIVEEVGTEVSHVQVGDRVVVPFTISCGHCWMCERGLMSQCETTQVTGQGKGAALFGYTELYGSVPGGQAEFLRVPQAQSALSPCRTASPTSGSSIFRTSCPPHGKAWSMPQCPPTESWPCSGWAPWASWPAASPGTVACE